MATNPGLFTEWPWQRLGSFKYIVVAPFALYGFQMMATAKDWKEVDWAYLMILPVLLMRVIHNLIWISISRYQNASSKNRIIDRAIEFEQVDRESNWDDQIILSTLLSYLSYFYVPGGRFVPLWRAESVIMLFLLHAGPVEFLYYWLHRALHHHFLYTRYHSHHHASIVTEPITSVIHPFAEIVAYYLLFMIPLVSCTIVGKLSIIGYLLYVTYLDAMNNMGHCNFEFVPKWLFQFFPPLKYLMYTPSYHSLHHTQFRTNYSLFMPFYDYIYNTMDKSSDTLYESTLKGKDETTDVVHLTHLTTLESIYHLRLGIATLAARPYDSKWYMLCMRPISWVSFVLTSICGSPFTVERNTMKKLNMQTWAIPRYSFQYGLKLKREAINDLIENAILEADKKGVKVVSLGLLNQGKDLNGSGELYLQKYPKLRVRLVDGSSLGAAIVIKSIPSGIDQVLLAGKLSKVACAVAAALCQKNVQVITTSEQDFHLLKKHLPENAAKNLSFSNTRTAKVWIVDEGLDEAAQRRAEKGTQFIPFSQFPPKAIRKDCTYMTTPAMKIPKTLQNMFSCENWLPRRVMSAWRIAGVVHALEGWGEHECGDSMLDVEKVWSAAIHHGFQALIQV